MPLKIFMCLLLVWVFVSGSAHAQIGNDKKYFPPSMGNIAQTYWRLGKFDISDNAAIDNFMRITQCDLYTEFINNEFEWQGIQRSSKEFLESNRNNFPLRYQFLQKITLGGYDFERKGFNIAKGSSIDGIRIFEMPSLEYKMELCGDKNPIPGYPTVVQVELSRPLNLNFFPFDEASAKALIDNRMSKFNTLSSQERKYVDTTSYRDIVFAMNVKMFAYNAPDELVSSGGYKANILATLEEVYIYEDSTLQNILFYKNFRVKPDRETVGNEKAEGGAEE